MNPMPDELDQQANQALLRLMEHAASINALGSMWCEQNGDLMVWGVCLKSVLHPGKHVHFENATPDLVVDEAIEDTQDWGGPASFWEMNACLVDCQENDHVAEGHRTLVARRPNLHPMHPLNLQNNYAMNYLN